MGEFIAEVFSVSGLFTLLMLLLLQAVLGFDNLLYISIESQRVGPEKAPMVRRWGIAIAVILRIVLLIVIVNLFALLAEPLFDIGAKGLIEGDTAKHVRQILRDRQMLPVQVTEVAMQVRSIF